ncbi:hypothetical protein D1872_306590 [compost metagenome]
MAVGLVEFPSRLQSLLRLAIVPCRIDQTEHPAGSDLGFELVRLLHKTLLIQQSDIIHVIKPAEILPFLRAAEMVSHVKGLLVDEVFAVIRRACRKEAHIRHLIHMPIIRVER